MLRYETYNNSSTTTISSFFSSRAMSSHQQNNNADWEREEATDFHLGIGDDDAPLHLDNGSQVCLSRRAQEHEFEFWGMHFLLVDALKHGREVMALMVTYSERMSGLVDTEGKILNLPGPLFAHNLSCLLGRNILVVKTLGCFRGRLLNIRLSLPA